ncbi:MAG: hypothetical protein JXR25_10035 [Pontiellaceae bacterium]|nr:hypothetical protein [Pontiellaceae bacterium]MBN2785157.1 hypothetical protein [Pontiellaceae bacterium]
MNESFRVKEYFAKALIFAEQKSRSHLQSKGSPALAVAMPLSVFVYLWQIFIDSCEGKSTFCLFTQQEEK